MRATAVIARPSAALTPHMCLQLSGTDTAIPCDQVPPEQLWLGSRIHHRTLLRDPETLSPQAQRYSLHPAGHPQGYQDCFDAFVADSYAAAGGAAVDGLPTFADGLRAARITEAVLTSAATDGAWTRVPGGVA